jgi:hypothetical protein
VSIGNDPAFPSDNLTDCGGMTYRQWLVGMALQGAMANVETLRAIASTASRQGVAFSTAIALSVIEQADKVITELEKQTP